MSAKKSMPPEGAPPTSKKSEVRPAAREDERRRADRWATDAKIEILSPIQETVLALDMSKTGMRISLREWLSAGTSCDLRITTHASHTFVGRARVVWTRRQGNRCVSGLEIMGSIAPDASDQD